jgi:osmotically-inducible protein OsmY
VRQLRHSTNYEDRKMNNEDVAAAIRAALQRDRDIDPSRSKIEVRLDEVLRLEGEVEDIAIKRKALRVAREVTHSQNIQDHLRLALAERVSDEQLRDAAVRDLSKEPAFARMDISTGADKPRGQEEDWIRVRAEEGVVRLTGEVNSLSHRRLAEVIAWWVPGSCDVDNHLHVRPPEQETDEEIADAVRLVFDKEPAFDAGQIAITTRNREVILRGAVFSEDQKRRATQDCWYIPGIHAVRNDLQVLSR